jgi:hypothetical protein
VSEPLYGHHNGDYVTFGEWYAKHVDAMTAEGLHSKTAIAWELAYRDETIVHLQAKLTEAQKDAERYRWLRDSHPACGLLAACRTKDCRAGGMNHLTLP